MKVKWLLNSKISLTKPVPMIKYFLAQNFIYGSILGILIFFIYYNISFKKSSVPIFIIINFFLLIYFLIICCATLFEFLLFYCLMNIYHPYLIQKIGINKNRIIIKSENHKTKLIPFRNIIKIYWDGIIYYTTSGNKKISYDFFFDRNIRKILINQFKKV